MAPRHWTILIVPPGTGATRAIRVGPRMRRALLGGAAAAGLLVASAAAVLFTPYATPGARTLLVENARLQARMDRIDARLAVLHDTLTALGVSDDQLQLLAGAPGESADSLMDESSFAASSAGDGLGALASVFVNPLAKPFFDRIGFANHADLDGLMRRAGELSRSFRSVSDSMGRNFERLARTPSIMPTVGWLSSQFSQSRLNPVLHENRPHEGIDVSAPMGAPIVAPASGRVISVSNEPGYGNTFEIDHGNGIVTRYAHCSRVVVHVGEQVTRGQLIATVGNTGIATGPHLHYEVHVNGRPVDPLKYVLQDAEP